MTMVKRQVASLAQRIAINDLMKGVLNKVEGSDLWTYKADWSDQRIADQVKCNLTSVIGVRQELYGRLRKTNKDEDRLAKIERELHELRVKYHKLATTLALKQVADVRHLTLADMEHHVATAPPKVAIVGGK